MKLAAEQLCSVDPDFSRFNQQISFQAKVPRAPWRDRVHADEPDQAVQRTQPALERTLDPAHPEHRLRQRVQQHHELRLRQSRRCSFNGDYSFLFTCWTSWKIGSRVFSPKNRF